MALMKKGLCLALLACVPGHSTFTLPSLWLPMNSWRAERDVCGSVTNSLGYRTRSEQSLVQLSPLHLEFYIFDMHLPNTLNHSLYHLLLPLLFVWNGVSPPPYHCRWDRKSTINWTNMTPPNDHFKYVKTGSVQCGVLMKRSLPVPHISGICVRAPYN